MVEGKKQYLQSKGKKMEQELKIGNCQLKNPWILAPMAGITDHPFRMVCEDYQPGLVYTEMISAKGLFYNDEKTNLLLEMDGEKRPIAVQIFGSEPRIMAYAAKYVQKWADIVDINMGCPAPKIVKNGDGSKLLLDLERAGEIVKAVAENTEKPVSVKLRLGWNKEHIVAVEAAQRFEEAGAKALAVHGRTREEFYQGTANWDVIRKVKENVTIPVIGNGDVVDSKSAKRMLEETKVDAVMIGRGAIGRPWIFQEIASEFIGKPFEINKEEILQVMLKHIDLAIKQKREQIAIKEMRKHISYYIKNQKNATNMRNRINTITSRKELEACLISYFQELENSQRTN